MHEIKSKAPKECIISVRINRYSLIEYLCRWELCDVPYLFLSNSKLDWSRPAAISRIIYFAFSLSLFLSCLLHNNISDIFSQHAIAVKKHASFIIGKKLSHIIEQFWGLVNFNGWSSVVWCCRCVCLVLHPQIAGELLLQQILQKLPWLLMVSCMDTELFS